MVIYNKGDPDDYNTEPSHPSDQEEEGPWPENKDNYEHNYEHNAQLPEILEEFSDTELGREEDSEESEEETGYPKLEKTLQEAEGKVKDMERGNPASRRNYLEKSPESHSYMDRIGRHQRKARGSRRHGQNLERKI